MKNILVAIDSITSITPASPVIRHAIEFARAFSSKIWLLHVVPPGRATTPFTVPREVLRDQVATELCQEHKSMQHLAQHLRDNGIEVTALLVEGSTVKMILGEAQRLAADLIVVGSHGHSTVYRALLGDIGERLLNESSRPILYVPESGAESPATAEWA